MPELNKTLWDETAAAARGVFALVMGERTASRFFSFTQAGLVSSFIAVLVMTGIELVFVKMSGAGGVFASVVQTAIIYAAVLAASAIYLRQIGRPDALVPFVVAINWANAVLTVVLLVIMLLGLPFFGIIVLILAIIITINVARLIMTLKPFQIVLLILVQTAGFLAAMLVIGLLFPPTPEDFAQAAALFNSPPS